MDLFTNLGEKTLNLIKFIFHILYAYAEAFYRFFFPPKMRSLKGEIILVTGSAKGIGAELCRQLAESKVTLVMWDWDKVQNDKTARELKAQGVRVYPYHIDVSDRNQVALTAAKVKQQVGDVTIVINNAAIAPAQDFLRMSPETIEKTFQVNVISHMWIIREFLPRMIENHHGHIATVCSVGGIRAMGASVPYYSTKFAVHGYIESLKIQLARLNCHGIRFTTIYPYFVDTELAKPVKYSKHASPRVEKVLPFLKPTEVAAKLIEGIRRSYEYVYIPSISRLFELDNLLPLKLRKQMVLNFESNFELDYAQASKNIKSMTEHQQSLKE